MVLDAGKLRKSEFESAFSHRTFRILIMSPARSVKDRSVTLPTPFIGGALQTRRRLIPDLVKEQSAALLERLYELGDAVRYVRHIPFDCHQIATLASYSNPSSGPSPHFSHKDA